MAQPSSDLIRGIPIFADLDEALQWAKEGSAACGGRVEVRPFAGEA